MELSFWRIRCGPARRCCMGALAKMAILRPARQPVLGDWSGGVLFSLRLCGPCPATLSPRAIGAKLQYSARRFAPMTGAGLPSREARAGRRRPACRDRFRITGFIPLSVLAHAQCLVIRPPHAPCR